MTEPRASAADDPTNLEAPAPGESSQDQILEAWAAEAGQGDHENRQEAVRRTKAWQETAPHEPPWLDLSLLSLTTLSAALPAGLQHLNIDGNQLTSVPDILPSGLQTLHARNNWLANLPTNLPASVECLRASGNRLTSLPATLPVGLQRLYVPNNQLTSLPATLPAGLTLLSASGNRLTSLPTTLPLGLRQLHVDNNRLTSLPETLLTQLGSGCLVDLDDNPLPARVRTNLTAATTAEGYAGPNVFFSDPDETAQARARPLPEAVADWLDEPDAAAIWRSFADEPGAEEYSRFLDRLRDTVNYDVFRRAVAADLRQAAGRPTLREHYFQAAVAANESCEDRIKLNWNGMQNARVNADVLDGAYNEHLDKLLQQGRIMFRLVALEGIAREKVTSLPFVDEIEVYLAYQAKLREPLELGHIAPDMRFVEVSYITEDDLAAAKTSVRNQEAAEFADFLATRWQPWDTLVSRIAPEAYAAMEGRMDEEMESRLTQRLADHQPTSDAEPSLQAQIRTEIVREIKGELMQKVLAEHGLERLLLPDNSATG
ncbi:hypothetical protein J2R76_003727 [Bradyrhizobium sp. USDA 4532]|uniref:NEL-type E3 ubiquitin ligase domain-containing protein n=1 Tax=unclassified Bradyrhizobium TaxID=2631580 RepID=UPI00209E73F9|nr:MULTISPECIES: NEL-type E3 ubiquitin ligase domain-containing protein [unclassified Bradyrhizobium]MCP1835390.1 hypothetical protein [Bradyrhizobium sp. USDA 4545]MCP1920136.1 hypothetical protein [Bradyrhizobium sp. USDA 4532]